MQYGLALHEVGEFHNSCIHSFICLFIIKNIGALKICQMILAQVLPSTILWSSQAARHLDTRINCGHGIQAKLGEVQILPHLLDEGLWASYFSSRSLTFPICKVGVLTPTLQGTCANQEQCVLRDWNVGVARNDCF